MSHPRSAALLITALLALPLASPSFAVAKGGGGGGGGQRQEVRVAGTCGKGATSRLRLRGRDGRLDVNFEIDHARSNRAWRVAIVQERRVVYRGRARTHAPGGDFELEKRLGDLPGADLVSVRAVGPGGLTCVASATLPG